MVSHREFIEEFKKPSSFAYRFLNMNLDFVNGSAIALKEHDMGMVLVYWIRLKFVLTNVNLGLMCSGFDRHRASPDNDEEENQVSEEIQRVGNISNTSTSMTTTFGQITQTLIVALGFLWPLNRAIQLDLFGLLHRKRLTRHFATSWTEHFNSHSNHYPCQRRVDIEGAGLQVCVVFANQLDLVGFPC